MGRTEQEEEEEQVHVLFFFLRSVCPHITPLQKHVEENLLPNQEILKHKIPAIIAKIQFLNTPFTKFPYTCYSLISGGLELILKTVAKKKGLIFLAKVCRFQNPFKFVLFDPN